MATKPDIFTVGTDRGVDRPGINLSDLFLSKLPVLGSNRIRTLRTVVSDADFEANDFMVAPVSGGNVLDRPEAFGGNISKLFGGSEFLHDGWLTQRPANHTAPPPGWLSGFDRRIVELREAAAEEELAFSEDSAAAARAFCEHHGRSIRPNIFLVGNGNVRLVWENDEEEQIGLQFRADCQKVQCILFKRREDGISAITAMETNAGLMELLAGNRLLHLLGKR